jgi:DNA-binding transcriptional MerR regulator/copper chaperone CopZ
MRIGELAAQADVTAKTVRYYESIGLLDEPERTPSGYRDYDQVALDRLRFIRDAQASGLSLAEIQSVLALKDAGSRSCSHTSGLLDDHLTDLDRQIRRLETTRNQLRDLAERAAQLDPADCTDPNRCQVIDTNRHPPTRSRPPTAPPGTENRPVSPQPRVFTVPGISCDHCKQAIETRLGDTDGVQTAVVDVAAKTVTVAGPADDDTVVEGIRAAGYEVA